MTNHIHLLVAALEDYQLHEIVRDFKRHTTQEIKKLILKDRRQYILRLISKSFSKKKGQVFQIWQDKNYPEVITGEKFYQQKLNYVHNNPVRKGYVQKPEDWLYSSARNYYLQDNSLIKIDYLN